MSCRCFLCYILARLPNKVWFVFSTMDMSVCAAFIFWVFSLDACSQWHLENHCSLMANPTQALLQDALGISGHLTIDGVTWMVCSSSASCIKQGNNWHFRGVRWPVFRLTLFQWVKQNLLSLEQISWFRPGSFCSGNRLGCVRNILQGLLSEWRTFLLSSHWMRRRFFVRD